MSLRLYSSVRISYSYEIYWLFWCYYYMTVPCLSKMCTTQQVLSQRFPKVTGAKVVWVLIHSTQNPPDEEKRESKKVKSHFALRSCSKFRTLIFCVWNRKPPSVRLINGVLWAILVRYSEKVNRKLKGSTGFKRRMGYGRGRGLTSLPQ